MSGFLQVIVQEGDEVDRMVAMFPTQYLPEWLSMDGLVPVPPVQGTAEGAALVREIYRVSARRGQPMMGCLCALWISLFGPGLPPGLGLSLDDLLASENSTMTIRVNRDLTRWEFVLTGRRGDQGGRRDVPGLGFETVGTA